MERTLVLIKPDAVQRGLIGAIVGRFEQKGLKIIAMKMMKLDRAMLQEHYAHLKDQPFFPKIAAFMMSAPIIALCIEGLEAIKVVRSMCGVTNSREATPGTIRGDLAMSTRSNLVHASDSPANAAKEIELFFSEQELFKYENLLEHLIHIPDGT
jgi:nucleoside-diphosphate kinase